MSISLATLSKNMVWTKTPSQKIDGDGVSSQWEGEHTRFEGYTPVSKKYHYISGVRDHTCRAYKPRGKGFVTTKECEADFPWKMGDRMFSWNVPRDRVNDFCPNCRRSPEEEFESFGIEGRKKYNYWECMCS